MSDQEYIVTLHRKEDLEQFYTEMKLANFPLAKKRPISRNTHYMMTADQAEKLKEDPRVLDVELADSIKFVRVHNSINKDPYDRNGDHFKNAPVGTSYDPNWRQWGHLHCAGDLVQRRKGSWGDGTTNEVVVDDLEIYSNGKHVDVVIVDDPVSFDSEEWYSPTISPGQSRFVQYQWFNELNSIVNSIDDDNQTEPTGTITYGDNGGTSQYHGNHVAGTTAGQFYGWAPEANIYNIAVTDPWPSGQQVGALLIFDYLRAFHANKPVNPDTGYRNPTISNHSYGGVVAMPNENLQLSDVTMVTYQGVSYDANNPGPSGWTTAGLQADFGVRFGLDFYPSYSSSVAADVQDAIEDGVVIVGSAGNDNLLMAEYLDGNWNNTITINGVGTRYYNRGGWPCTPDTDAIIVGSLSDHSDFRRSTFTNFGPGVTVFAPGDQILSAYGNTGFNDTKYSAGTGNFYRYLSGTSMASPQVAGVLAATATGNPRFTQSYAKGYLNKTNLIGDMTFDINGGGLDDNTCRQGSPNAYLRLENPRPESGLMVSQSGDRTTGMTYPRVLLYNRPAPQAASLTYTFTVTNSGSSHYVFTGIDANTSHSNSNDPTINCSSGDILVFNVNASGHPFLVKTSPTTGTGNQVSSYLGSGNGVTGNGRTNGTVTFYTEGLTGTYYYICQFHGGMVGSIIIS